MQVSLSLKDNDISTTLCDYIHRNIQIQTGLLEMTYKLWGLQHTEIICLWVALWV